MREIMLLGVAMATSGGISSVVAGLTSLGELLPTLQPGAIQRVGSRRRGPISTSATTSRLRNQSMASSSSVTPLPRFRKSSEYRARVGRRSRDRSSGTRYRESRSTHSVSKPRNGRRLIEGRQRDRPMNSRKLRCSVQGKNWNISAAGNGTATRRRRMQSSGRICRSSFQSPRNIKPATSLSVIFSQMPSRVSKTKRPADTGMVFTVVCRTMTRSWAVFRRSWQSQSSGPVPVRHGAAEVAGGSFAQRPDQ